MVALRCSHIISQVHKTPPRAAPCDFPRSPYSHRMSQEHATTQQLKLFSPLDGLKRENLGAMTRKAVLEEFVGGRYLFKGGERDKRTFFLLDGEIELLNQDKLVRVIRSGTDEARHALAPVLPRRLSARCRGAVKCITIDSDLLDVMLTWDQTGSYEVNDLRKAAAAEEPDADDWMTMMLQNKALHKIPPANLQAVFMRMERIHQRKGNVVIKQGEAGDYFYVLIDGTAEVVRETPMREGNGIKLAEIKPGDTFGEEALISGAKRNATITMLSDGALMRLGKEDFQKLLNEPMLSWVSYDRARRIVADGGNWLDVRLPAEFQHGSEKDALNIPLYFIRFKMHQLDKKTRYVVCCDTARRSSAAAYILCEHGYDAYVLKGGLAVDSTAKSA